MAWRKPGPDPFPAPLRGFREQDWPPVEGECLGHYACRGEGYERPCVPRPGEACGQRCYELLAAEHGGRPEVLAAARRADAYERFHRARLSWLGEGTGGYAGEMIEGWQAGDRIRYAPFRGEAV
jgi:hypothetical protein